MAGSLGGSRLRQDQSSTIVPIGSPKTTRLMLPRVVSLNTNGELVVAAERDRGGVHDADAIREEAVERHFGEHRSVRETHRIAVVDPFDLGRLAEAIGVNFHGAQRGGGVGREVGVPRPGRENEHSPLLEVALRASANVRLRDLADFDRRHDARRNARFFKGVLQREGVDDGGEHAHVVGLGAVHPDAGPFEAAEDVPTADDDAYLDAEGVDLRQLDRCRAHHGGLDSESAVGAAKRFAAEL